MTQKTKTGSLTVEASLLMPVILGTVLLVIYFGLYGYDRALCTYYCYETGRAMADGQKEITLDGQEMFLKQQAIGLKQVHMTKKYQGEQISISASAVMEIPFPGKPLVIEETQTVYALDQRRFILRCQSTFQKLLKKESG